MTSTSRRANGGYPSDRLDAAAQLGARHWWIDRAGCAIRVRQLTVRNPRICSSAGMLVLILTMLVLLSSVLAVSWLDRNALR
jgi:hypothetical protein